METQWRKTFDDARGRLRRLRGRWAADWRHAFSLASPHGPLDEADRALLSRLAEGIARRQMGAPAILFLESLRPLNYIGSQALVFLRPFLTPVLSVAECERLTNILERREGLGALVDAIESASAAEGRNRQ